MTTQSLQKACWCTGQKIWPTSLFSRIHLLTYEVCSGIRKFSLIVANLLTLYLCYRSVHVRSEVITIMTMKSTTFWHVMLHAVWLTFQPEDEGSTFLWKVCKLLQYYTMSNTSRQDIQSSYELVPITVMPFTASTHLFQVCSTFLPEAGLATTVSGIWNISYSKRLLAERAGFDSHQCKIFVFSTSSRQTPGLTQTPIQWALGPLSPRVKRPGPEADHSPSFNAEYKKSTTLPPLPHMSSWRGL
jgi:hypothetical protein